MKKRGFSLAFVIAVMGAMPALAPAHAADFAPLRGDTGKQAFAEVLLRACGCVSTTTTTTSSTTTTSK